MGLLTIWLGVEPITGVIAFGLAAAWGLATGKSLAKMQELAKENRILAMVTHVADILCANQKLGVTITVECENVNPAYLQELGINDEQLADVSDHIEEELDVVRTLIE